MHARTQATNVVCKRAARGMRNRLAIVSRTRFAPSACENYFQPAPRRTTTTSTHKQRHAAAPVSLQQHPRGSNVRVSDAKLVQIIATLGFGEQYPSRTRRLADARSNDMHALAVRQRTMQRGAVEFATNFTHNTSLSMQRDATQRHARRNHD